jgi:hypothetical protein
VNQDRSGANADRILVAQLTGEARHRARWRPLTEDEEAAALAELRELAGGRADLLAEVAGIFEGTSEGEPDEPLARSAARLCRMAGADTGAIPAWIEEGRRRSETPGARRSPKVGPSAHLLAGASADIGAVQAQADAPDHLGYVLSAQVYVGVGDAGLRAVVDRVDGSGQHGDVYIGLRNSPFPGKPSRSYSHGPAMMPKGGTTCPGS